MSEQNPEQLCVCFLNPALLPDWFWLPSAQRISERVNNYVIPRLPRGEAAVPMDQRVDMVEAVLQEHDELFLVSLSRGVEDGIRYVDRLARQNALHRVLGWMVISSVGPRGYESDIDVAGIDTTRHALEYVDGLKLNDQGLEELDSEIAQKTMLHDIPDPKLTAYVIDNLSPERPLTDEEVSRVPAFTKGLLSLSWYIGRNDKVDNTELSAVVARQKFGVQPTDTDWGHVGPLSHTDEVAEAILFEIGRAYNFRQRGGQ